MNPPVDPPQFPVDCEGLELFRTLTGRWGMVILLVLGGGPARYFELRNRFDGISEKMLAQTLRALQYNGLVARSETISVPPQVTYELTALGRRFLEPLTTLQRTIEETVNDVRIARLQA